MQFAALLQGHLPTLATERLILCAPRVDDFEFFADIACGPRGRYLGGPMSREAAWDDFARMTATWLLHGHGVWTIANAGGVQGFVLIGFEPGDREPELGILLTELAEGRGIAAEAMRAARAHAFEEYGWTSVVSYVDPENTRAIALMHRLGAHPDADAPDGAQAFRHQRMAA